MGAIFSGENYPANEIKFYKVEFRVSKIKILMAIDEVVLESYV